MPTYEYRCTVCGAGLERRQSITADPLTECPECGGGLRRMPGGGGAILVRESGSGRDACTLERQGTTCCGRSQRCDTPGCEGG